MHGTYLGDGRMLVRTTWGANLVASARDLSLTPDLVALGGYDAPLTNFLLAELRPGDVAFDVGANIGLFTVLMARQVGTEGRVVAYEAEPANAALLRDNVALNYLNERVEIVERAASDAEGRAAFFRTERFAGNSSLVRHDRAYFRYFGVDRHRRIRVRTEPLDRHAGRFARIALVKIDVEGAELRVLRGMRRLIADGVVRRIALEVVAQRMDDWPALGAWFRERVAEGWSLATLGPDGGREPLELERLLEVGWFSQVLVERE
jgi:FkbM family methyltransferase